MDDLCKAYYKSPIGTVEIAGTDEGIYSIYFVDEDREQEKIPSCLQECVRQIDEYFKGSRKEFSLKLLPNGTEFQKKVWNSLMGIPYGSTVSYADIAYKTGNPKAVRAVGSANGKNRIWIAIPCHRVIGSDGSLTGYAGGVWRKEWLLKHEKRFTRL